MRTAGTVTRRSVLGGIALLAAGCAGTSRSAPGPDLVWAIGSVESDLAPARSIADQWNTAHPNGPKVHVEALLTRTTDDRHQLLALELNAGNSEFDILDLDVVWTAEFAQNGWLVNLDELRPDIERISLPAPVKTAGWDGILWATPYITDVGILYYRSDWVDRPPATWQQLLEVGRRVGGQQSVAPYVADGRQYEGLVVQYLEYFWGAGGELLDADGRSVIFQREPALRAINFMAQAFRDGFYAPGFDTMDLEDALQTFQSGQAVFMRAWPSAYQRMNNDPQSLVRGKVGIAPLPTFAGARPVTALGGHNLAVSTFSDNVPAATEFVKFVSSSREVQRRLVSRYSLAPTLSTVYADATDDPMMALLARVVSTARPRPAVPEWSTISEEMQQQIFAAYTGDIEPRHAIDALRTFLVATIQDR